MTKETFEAIQRYCHQGWAVFPCVPGGKAPAVKNGFKAATKDPLAAFRMFEAVPNANIGIACGESGLTIVDVDPRNGGTVEAARELVGGIFDVAPVVHTGGGGTHHYFQGKTSSGELAPGIDVKSVRGYVLAPPSITDEKVTGKPGGPYKWSLPIPSEIPFLPESFHLAEKPKPKAEAEVRFLHERQRELELFRAMSAMRRHGAARETMLESARAFNARQCIPPLGDEEVEHAVDSAYRYPDQQPARVVLRSFQDIMTTPAPPPKFVVNNLILERQINMICGAPMTGKSMLALDMAVSIASGKDVLGQERFYVPQPRRTVYLYAEQGADMWELRARGLARLKGVTPELYLAAGYELQLNKESHLENLIETLIACKAEAVILDPLVVLFGLTDENDSTEIARFVRVPLQRIIDEGITPILIHHASKAATIREPSTARDLVRGSGDIIAMLGSIIGVWYNPKRAAIKGMTAGRMSAVKPFLLRWSDPVEGRHSLSADVSLEDMLSEATKVQVLEYEGDWERQDDSAVILEKLPNTFTAAGAAQALGYTRVASVYSTLKDLEDEGAIFSAGKVREGERGPEAKVWSKFGSFESGVEE